MLLVHARLMAPRHARVSGSGGELVMGSFRVRGRRR